MRRADTEEFVIGAISLLANRLNRFGEALHPDITSKQWSLLTMISRMDENEKRVRDIADYMGSSRQNVKKMLSSLEAKGFVTCEQSEKDGRALTVELTEKTHRYLRENEKDVAGQTNDLFAALSNAELNNLAFSLQKLSDSLDKIDGIE